MAPVDALLTAFESPLTALLVSFDAPPDAFVGAFASALGAPSPGADAAMAGARAALRRGLTVAAVLTLRRRSRWLALRANERYQEPTSVRPPCSTRKPIGDMRA